MILTLTLALMLVFGSISSAAEAQEPCCKVVSVDLAKRLVTAQEKATGETLRFKVRDAALLRTLRAGMSFGVEPELDALAPGQRFSIRLATSHRRLQPRKAGQCCELLSDASDEPAAAPPSTRAGGKTLTERRPSPPEASIRPPDAGKAPSDDRSGSAELRPKGRGPQRAPKQPTQPVGGIKPAPQPQVAPKPGGREVQGHPQAKGPYPRRTPQPRVPNPGRGLRSPAEAAPPDPRQGGRTPPPGSKPLLSTDHLPPGRPVDLNRYCRDRYAGGGVRAGTMEAVLIEPGDADSWRCRHTWGESTTYREISIAEACTMQWGPWAEAQLGNRSDPYSWSCTLPPATVLEPRLHKVRTPSPGHGPDGKADDLELFFFVRHVSPVCSGDGYYKVYRLCDEWAYTWRQGGIRIGTYVIEHRMPRLTLYPGDALVVDWFAREHGRFNTYDECGIRSGGAVITPVSKLFTEEDNWGIGYNGPTYRGGPWNPNYGRREPPETAHMECLSQSDGWGDPIMHIKIEYFIDKIE